MFAYALLWPAVCVMSVIQASFCYQMLYMPAFNLQHLQFNLHWLQPNWLKLACLIEKYDTFGTHGWESFCKEDVIMYVNVMKSVCALDKDSDSWLFNSYTLEPQTVCLH